MRTRVGQTVLLARLQSALRLAQLRRCNELHRLYNAFSQCSFRYSSVRDASVTHLGDFLNVAHRLQAHLDFTQSRHVPGTRRGCADHRGLRDATYRLPGEHDVDKGEEMWWTLYGTVRKEVVSGVSSGIQSRLTEYVGDQIEA